MPDRYTDPTTGDNDLDALLEQLVLELSDLFPADSEPEDKECGQ